MGPLIWLAAAAAAEVWEVGPAGDVASLAEAIAAAADGDLIVVAPGVYEECLVLEGRDLRIHATGAVEQTRLSCPGGVALRSVSQPATASVRGLTIAASGGTAVELVDSSLRLHDLRVEAAQRGLSVSGGAPVLVGLVVEGVGGAAGGGLEAVDADLRVYSSVFLSNQAPGDGGAWRQVGGSAWMSDVRFVGNEAVGQGGAIALDGVAWRASGLVLEDNVAGGAGGGAWVSGGSVELWQPEVARNAAGAGGGLAVQGTELVVQGGLWSGNTAVGAGGAIEAAGGLWSRGGRFVGNAAGSGGAVSVLGAARLAGNAWQGNSAVGQGGAVEVQGTLEALHEQYTANAAAVGGAVYLLGEAVGAWQALRFTSNQAGARGGGLVVEAVGEVELSAVELLGNGSDGEAGGLWASAGAVRVVGGRWWSNRAGAGGGAAVLAGTEVSLVGLDVQGNGAAGNGGWLSASGGGSLVLEGVTVSGNHSGYDGGLYASGFASARVERVDVVDNSAFHHGAGLYFAGVPSLRVWGSRFCDNQTSFGNTALRADGAASVVQHNLFVRNEGASNDTAGALGLDGADVGFNTFVGNRYVGSGGASFQLAFLSNRVASLHHNVFADDEGASVLGCGLGGCFLGVAYNAIDTDGGLVPALRVAGAVSSVDAVSNRLDVDPGFVSYGPTVDCRAADLRVGASLIDQGAPGWLDDDGSPADLGATGGLGAPSSDRDGDGLSPWQGDCDDDDPLRGAGVELPGDGVDSDCDGLDGADADGDGWIAGAVGGDCDDGDALVHPGATDLWYDGVDADCDGANDDDQDHDGFAASLTGGLDCDDRDGSVHPDAVDRTYDGVDADCDGRDDFDRDRDGLAALGFGGDDCDDTTDALPAVAEVWYDGVDGDCSGGSDFDADLDGYTREVDCDDGDPAVSPGADELPNGLDDDCDGRVDEDEAVECGTVFGWSCAVGGGGVGGWWLLPLLWLRRRRSWVAVVGLAACADGTEPVQPGYDGDEDGAVAGVDCRDQDPAVGPEAAELCNGVDDDCDGEVDEGVAVALFGDADGDGFGSDARAGRGCPGAGWVEVGGDCDDARLDVHPGAVELCDGVDQSCSGDEADAVDPAVWYSDVDGDGFGAEAVESCAPPAGFVAVGGDCDDARADVGPGQVERCGGVDEDCDGSEDLGAVDTLPWFLDVDSDGVGAGEPVWSCAAPAGAVAASGDCDDGEAAVRPGVVEQCGNGVDEDCDGAGCGLDGQLGLDAASWCVGGAGQYGSALALGDVDGDGADDLVIANPFPPGGTPYLEVRYGPWLPAPAADLVVQGEPWTFLGWSVQLGDLDGDGVVELVSGAALDWAGPPAGGGSVRVASLLARPMGVAGITSLGVTVDGTARDTYAGTAVAIGEATGDGVSDLAIGAPAHLTGPRLGQVHLVPGPFVVDGSLASASVTVQSVSQLDDLGLGVEIADLNGDGAGDLVVAAPGWQGAGGVFVFLGPVAAGVYDVEQADVQIVGHAGSRLGGLEYDAVQSVDLDEDGALDLLIGGPALRDPSGAATGGVLWFAGPVQPGVYGPGDAQGAVYGSQAGSGFGASLAVLGDVDGDGVEELAVGATAEVHAGGVGAVHVVPVPLAGVAVSAGRGVWAAGAGVAVAAAGDADGDGFNDLFVSLLPTTSAGQTCLWRGGAGR
jgi:hypothetical protein